MIQIILITAVLRTKNLLYILENLKNVFKDYKSIIEPMWVLCFDKFNAKIDKTIISKITKECTASGIRISIYYQGEPNKENYGGTLFNLPLKDLKNHTYMNSNPFVYILDDDNILSTSFPRFLQTIDKLPEYSLYWMNMVDEFGSHRFARYADALAYRQGTGVNSNYRVIHPCASLDPSQFITKLDFILDIGGFTGERSYDYDFMNNLYYNPKFQNVVWYQGNKPWIRDNTYHSSTCYHNALVKRSDIADTIRDIEKDDLEDSYIKVHVKSHNYIIPLNNKQLKEILKVAQNYKI